MSADLEVADVFRHCGEAYRRAHDGQSTASSGA
jgi:hypothetical protein